MKRQTTGNRDAAALLPGLAVVGLLLAPSAHARSTFVGHFPEEVVLASTVPANGDINPYGVAVVPRTVGNLVRGHVLVSNFNDATNAQGTGTTIVDVAPDGTSALFAQIDVSALPGPCPGGVGLTTALSVLRQGVVIVGSLPTSDGTSATMQAGCLLVLDSTGHVVETFSGGAINGPWDMTALDNGDAALLFVANVLNGPVAGSPSTTEIDQGTVVRIALAFDANARPRMMSETVIGSGFAERTDPAALVVGPTGVGLAADGTLYVADTVASRIAAIPRAVDRRSSAWRGVDVAVGGALNAPLGLAIAPSGDILTVNGGDGNLVETTPGGVQVMVSTVNANGGGALFGLAVAAQQRGLYFVDDVANALDFLHRTSPAAPGEFARRR